MSSKSRTFAWLLADLERSLRSFLIVGTIRILESIVPCASTPTCHTQIDTFLHLICLWLMTNARGHIDEVHAILISSLFLLDFVLDPGNNWRLSQAAGRPPTSKKCQCYKTSICVFSMFIDVYRFVHGKIHKHL